MNQHQRRGRPQSGLLVYLVYSVLIAGLVALAGLLTAGCGSATRVVVLSHPETRQVAECRANRWRDFDRRAGVESCVSAYRRAGFVVVGDSD